MLNKIVYCSFLVHYRRYSAFHITRRFMMSTIDPSLLAQDWAEKLIDDADDEVHSKQPPRMAITAATERSLPLLEDANSVPFVCRYRADVISPLTTRQIHLLYALLQKHAKLASLRDKLLPHVKDDSSMMRRVQTSTSKSELEALYAPYKPPSKGSILERIQKEHPDLVAKVDALWNGDASFQSVNLVPKTALVHLLSTKIAAEMDVFDTVMEELTKHCRVKCSSNDPKYRNYNDFSVRLESLRDHQILAIRRGVDQKAVKMGYEIDGDKIQGCIRYRLYNKLMPDTLKASSWRPVLDESIHDAWTRVLRRRGTGRLWSKKCKLAEERAVKVFEQNLYHALLAPPMPSAILALDPGFQAGIKCAILDRDGNVVKLNTVEYLGKKRDSGMRDLRELLSSAHGMLGKDEKVIVALGNGHGSQEGRILVNEVANAAQIPIDIQLVNEAGASVWSVTEAAKDAFPDQQPAAIASVSIGRRLQNPLHELVKVPPRSLGLGMYQHDLSEKELDEKLNLVSVDSVATVGVDVNTCSIQILEKVPGLSKLAAKIAKARPLHRRADLLKVTGLGPKTFENCAAFVRVERSEEALDSTLVHPESYKLARWILQKCNWKLSEKPLNVPPTIQWKNHYQSLLQEASDKFDVSQERVLSVMENLVDSMMQIDPRLRGTTTKPVAKAGSLDGCVLLDPKIMNDDALRKAVPLRGIVATIRNIADFGAFCDFGGHTDGLLHTSKLGPVPLQSLLIGQQVGVDILAADQGRVSLSLTGLSLVADGPRKSAATTTQRRKYSSASHASSKHNSNSAGKKRNRSTKLENTHKRRKTN